jgi:glyoxylase-like metal-dependent hydrolase (beta-lactamase superfamily II)
LAQNRRGRGCGCLLVVLALAAAVAGGVYYKFYRPKGPQLPRASGGELQIHVLDVGQGDAILILAPSGKVALIDAGDANHAKVVRDALGRYNVQQLDYFIATHPHPDHIGGAPEIFKSIKVATMLDSGIPPPDFEESNAASTQNAKGGKAKPKPPARARNASLPTIKAYTDLQDAAQQSGTQVVHVAPHQRYDLGGGVLLTVLAPIPPPFTKDQMRGGGNEPNANSVVLRCRSADRATAAQRQRRHHGAHLEGCASWLQVRHDRRVSTPRET